MSQIAGYIYSASGQSFTLQDLGNGNTWLVTDVNELVCKMTFEEFKGYEEDVEVNEHPDSLMVRYPSFDAFLIENAIRHLRRESAEDILRLVR